MKKNESITTEIKALILKHNISSRELEKISGISHQTFCNILNDKYPLKRLDCDLLDWLIKELGEDKVKDLIISHVKFLKQENK